MDGPEGPVALDLGSVDADDFAPHLESAFAATTPAGDTFALTLVDVCRGSGGVSREPFTLTLTGGPHPHLPQGILRLDHDVLGRLDLFLVPIGPGGDGQHRYEAVFA
jgi:hypothetical protein